MGDVGLGPEAVYLTPGKDGLIMPNGKDVFVNACTYMEKGLKKVLKKQKLNLSDLTYLVPHQANDRIITNLSHSLYIKRNQIFINIDKLGNTGCASTGICLSENRDRLKSNDLLGFTVFGGGYSCGAMLVRVL